MDHAHSPSREFELLCASDISQSGAKCFYRVPYASLPLWYSHFFAGSNSPSLYEILRRDSPLYLFFDLEAPSVSLSFDEFFGRVTRLSEIFQSILRCSTPTVLHCPKLHKHSFHLIFNRSAPLFDSLLDFPDYIRSAVHDPNLLQIIDFRVYSSIRFFRTVQSSKFGENSPFKLIFPPMPSSSYHTLISTFVCPPSWCLSRSGLSSRPSLPFTLEKKHPHIHIKPSSPNSELSSLLTTLIQPFVPFRMQVGSISSLLGTSEFIKFRCENTPCPIKFQNFQILYTHRSNHTYAKLFLQSHCISLRCYDPCCSGFFSIDVPPNVCVTAANLVAMYM